MNRSGENKNSRQLIAQISFACLPPRRYCSIRPKFPWQANPPPSTSCSAPELRENLNQTLKTEIKCTSPAQGGRSPPRHSQLRSLLAPLLPFPSLPPPRSSIRGNTSSSDKGYLSVNEFRAHKQSGFYHRRDHLGPFPGADVGNP